VHAVVLPVPAGGMFTRGISQSQHERNYLQRLVEMEAELAAGRRWRLVGSAMVMRPAIIVPKPDPIEERYNKFRLERDNYFTINPERNMELMEEDRRRGAKGASRSQQKKKEKVTKDKEAKEATPTAAEKVVDDVDLAVDRLYQRQQEKKEREDTLEDVRARMEILSPRVTAADLADDRRSLQRALDSPLYLIVRKPRSSHAWQFPQGGRLPGETMRQCCVRELKEEVGTQLRVQFVNAPSGCYSYPYPSDSPHHREGFYGAKVFFIHAEYISGAPRPDGKEIVDYAWVKQDELSQYFDPDLFNYVKYMLL